MPRQTTRFRIPTPNRFPGLVFGRPSFNLQRSSSRAGVVTDKAIHLLFRSTTSPSSGHLGLDITLAATASEMRRSSPPFQLPIEEAFMTAEVHRLIPVSISRFI